MSDYTNFKTHSGMKLFFHFCTSLTKLTGICLTCTSPQVSTIDDLEQAYSNGGSRATCGPEATPERPSQKSREKPRKTRCKSLQEFLQTFSTTLHTIHDAACCCESVCLVVVVVFYDTISQNMSFPMKTIDLALSGLASTCLYPAKSKCQTNVFVL